ncbi:MAG TPA: orotidine-5'-phosphate decarboxylase [Bacteroidia bacterium]|nr:orotidine-5'-phosphate decarboxylase [Bacteroidia bacterium]
MTKEELIKQIQKKKSFLCIGLDTDSRKLPRHLLKHKNPVLEFNRQIIEATSPFCVAYKPNFAFYEADGVNGMETLHRTMELIPEDCFTIADAKRGDIGNTSAMYARAFFEHYGFDAVTVAPYMGRDSVLPFFGYEKKWVILLALTSNEGAEDFQMLNVFEPPQSRTETKTKLFEEVLTIARDWGSPENLMFVVGATRADQLIHVRKIVPDHFLLVPGVGAQGGSLAEVARFGMNQDCGLLVNASRSILYASDGEDFAEKAAAAARKMQQEMEVLLKKLPGKANEGMGE